MKLYFRHTLRTQWHWEISIIIRYSFHMYNIFHIKGKDNVWNSKDKWVRTRERERKERKTEKGKKDLKGEREKEEKQGKEKSSLTLITLSWLGLSQVHGMWKRPWQRHSHDAWTKGSSSSWPGWQKLCGGTGGRRRKVWTRTKILSLNIRYFGANFDLSRFTHIFWRSLGIKSAFLGKNSASWARSALLHGIYCIFYWVKFENLRLRAKTTHLSRKL